VSAQDHLQAIITLLSLVNPGICGAMFALAEAGRSRRDQQLDAAKVALAILVLLVTAALCGIKLLHLFGVSLDAFTVAGGGVLAWMGFAMLRGQPLASPAPVAAVVAAAESKESDATPSLTPLILFAASPGTITGVITLSIAHSRSELPLTAIVASSVATAVLWLTLLLFSRYGGVASGGGFVRDTVTRFTGLIVIAMGMQFALTGIRSFMLASGQ
jgi:small neutral amino acid transporter SnatA (MarC family)